MLLRDTLRGTGVALVTPFTATGAVDFSALQKLIHFVLDSGVEYVVSLGTTGETSTLSKEEKTEVVQATFEAVGTRAQVVVGVGGNNTAEVMKELERLPLEKATAVLSASPYYNKPSQEGIYQHYKALAFATTKPIILYNVPGRTGSNISAETVTRLAHEVDGIAGIKEASGNMIQCMHIIRNAPRDFLVVSGDDHLAMAQLACGMEGVISVAANCWPKDFSELVRAALKQDFVHARALNSKLLPGYDLLFAENNPAGVKAVLAHLGIIQNNLRLPLVPLSDGVAKQLAAYLNNLSA